MVVAHPKQFSTEPPMRVLCVENKSGTWPEIEKQIKKSKLDIYQRLESFATIACLAKSGYKPAIIPKPLAKSFGFDKSQLKPLSPKCYRHIHLVSQKTFLHHKHFNCLYSTLKRFLK